MPIIRRELGAVQLTLTCIPFLKDLHGIEVDNGNRPKTPQIAARSPLWEKSQRVQVLGRC